MTKMIPPVLTSAVMMPTPKQKIGFSIESIVGNDAVQANRNERTTHPATTLHTELHNSPKIEQQSKQDIQDIINRLHHNANNLVNNNHHHLINNSYGPPSPQQQNRLSSPEIPQHKNNLKRERSLSPASTLLPPPHAHLHQHSPSTSPTAPSQSSPPPPHPVFNMNKGPIHVPGLPPAGLVRPFPVPPPQHPDIKAIPAYINSPEMVPPQHPQHPGLLAAAQFQMAAALQAGHVLGPAAAAVAAGLPPHSPFLQQHPAMARDSYPLYPWLLSRHGRIFPHRFPGHFLLQPFRKPKRIRTAFSPSQLLKLEHAFESNQYVVGAERKQLAQSLNLSETQVKVWFQNRRTKHKRMQQEDEKGGCNPNGDNSGRMNSCDEDDDELIDMEMDDDCPSDDELDASH